MVSLKLFTKQTHIPAIISFAISITAICDSWVLPLDELSAKTILREAVYGKTGSQPAIENAKTGGAKASIYMCDYEEALTVLGVSAWPPSETRIGTYFRSFVL